MLYLTRKIDESIMIDDSIEVTVVAIRGRSVKLGVTFPAGSRVYRREVHDRIQAEKTPAHSAAGALATIPLADDMVAEDRAADDMADGGERPPAAARRPAAG